MCPLIISVICDSTVDLGYEDNMFDMLSGRVDDVLSIGYLSGYDASLHLYCIYLVDKPTKIIWNIFLNFSFDFSVSFALLKRALTFLAMIISVFSYYHAYEAHCAEFNKFLRALTTSDLKSRGLK